MPYGFLTALFLYVLVLEVFVWIIFIIIAYTIIKRNCNSDAQAEQSTSQDNKKNFVILAILFTMLGLPWLFIVVGIGTRVPVLFTVTIITDLLQGPIMFLFMGLRLTEVRQLWVRWICCVCAKKIHPHVSLTTTASRVTVDQA